MSDSETIKPKLKVGQEIKWGGGKYIINEITETKYIIIYRIEPI